ncbi:hypothetical protein M2271_002746 [Streptomyces sp. LBL]|uniref:hypothetical protein n=1 Tax=Streptomyces sp. LBL TaxID=2940562 RepID=UPI0024750554|nr:hypothetical protein [Streptomyces sp. LBL]MDH6624942.1 hypothetical protein [Streptomyces sp. LBL]
MLWLDGKQLGEHRMFDPAEATEDSSYSEPWMLPQWRTQKILFELLLPAGRSAPWRPAAPQPSSSP